MFKVMVVYKTKYGNTKKAAETIIDGMMELEGIDAYLGNIDETDPSELGDYDLVVIGSPNHIGRATRSAGKFIDKMAGSFLEGRIAVFDTCIGNDYGKAVRSMEKRIGEKLPKMKKILDGLSIRVEGMRGPISQEELDKCKKFGKDLIDKLKE